MLLLMIQVRVLAFGVLKDSLGAGPLRVELPEGAAVADLLAGLRESYPTAMLRGIAVSVNAVYATATHVLRDGDEVGLLPPVSGGHATRMLDPLDQSGEEPKSNTALTREPIDADKLVAASKHGKDGAVVVFDGIVRDNSRGRRTLHLDYEAYEEMALKQMNELAAQARERYGIRQVTIIHRLGRLLVGETSVLIVVASAHRAQAFDACRWLIDTLKKSVPIWKKETFVDGAVWADGEPFPEGMGIEATDAH
ncbi:MAG TPA: molybdenum cofactor biosynthesis protein MoaE [Terracidiphilus sp.]|nr:molybdenum cofactor biosynthesis protein MoaE [Terracidiphilus sp.]